MRTTYHKATRSLLLGGTIAAGMVGACNAVEMSGLRARYLPEVERWSPGDVGDAARAFDIMQRVRRAVGTRKARKWLRRFDAERRRNIRRWDHDWHRRAEMMAVGYLAEDYRDGRRPVPMYESTSTYARQIRAARGW